MTFAQELQNSIFFLIQKSSTTLPFDVQVALEKARQQESLNSNGEFSLTTIEENVFLAQNKTIPICQDTGFPTFYVTHTPNFSQKIIKQAIIFSIKKATKVGLLRPNAVDSISGKNSGDNTGFKIPKIIFTLDEESQAEHLKISLILKGGGSENVSMQHALPCKTSFGNAGRDLDGIKKVVLETIKNAEGKGCAPGIISVHIGGDRVTGFEQAKLNLFKNLNQPHEDKILENLAQEIYQAANQLKIGPMGLGGNSTVLAVKISNSHRIPASFFVTVNYNCWALRRGSISCDNFAKINGHSWENSPADFSKRIKNNICNEASLRHRQKLSKTNKINIKKLNFPLTEQDILDLKIGDRVLLSGEIFTGRDLIHHYVVAENQNLPIDISNSAIYHCGPVMKKESKTWQVIAAGPTTSIREEPYQAAFIKKTKIRGIIGKGGMGQKTLAALKLEKAVYFHAIGGAAAIYASKISQVINVHYLNEFGIPEALWQMKIKDFPVIVTMDAHGNSLH
jgi:fumarate hydratase class I